MASVLIVYGSDYGHTERIAARIGRRLAEAGLAVVLRRGNEISPEASIGEYDAVVVAGSVRFGRHQRCVEEFARRHAARLNAIPSAFVSVCGALIAENPETRKTADGYVAEFIARTGWHPQRTRSFSGGLAYTRYGFLVRWMMRSISARTGRPTDTSRDYDFTDWNAVDEFAREFAAGVPARRAQVARADGGGR